jgi:hypothetical protein
MTRINAMRLRLWMLPRAMLRLTMVGLRLRWCGFSATEHWLIERSLLASADSNSAADTARVADWVWAVAGASRLSPRKPACLTRSLTLWSLLRDEAIVSQVRVGARQVRSRLSAHAWVEYDGQVLNDDLDIARRFPPLGPSTGADP